jgi:hypothetical protein
MLAITLNPLAWLAWFAWSPLFPLSLIAGFFFLRHQKRTKEKV